MEDKMKVKLSEKYSLKREDYLSFLKNYVEKRNVKEVVRISVIMYLLLLYLIIKLGYSFWLLSPAVFMDLFCIAMIVLSMVQLHKEERAIHKLLDCEKEIVVECLEDGISILFKESNKCDFYAYDNLDLIELPGVVYINIPLLIGKNSCEEREVCKVLKEKIVQIDQK